MTMSGRKLTRTEERALELSRSGSLVDRDEARYLDSAINAGIIEPNAIPLEDQVCECGHWFDEHPDDYCSEHVYSPELSSPSAIADRGGDPEQWPAHVKRAFRMDA